MKSMEEILQEYFGCKKPFKKNETLSISGEMAYARLIGLLQDIDDLLGTDYVAKNIDKLDEIAKSDEKNMSRFVD